MPASPALRGHQLSDRIRIANAYRVNGVAATVVPEVASFGKAPPTIVLVGYPGSVPNPLSITVQTPGAIGTAVLNIEGATFTTDARDITYGRSLTSVTGPGQATALGIGANNSLTLFLTAGYYDSSVTYRVSWALCSAQYAPGPMIAAGLAPFDVTATSTPLLDSCFARVHTASTSAQMHVTMPELPWDGMRVAIGDVDGDGYTYPVVVTPNSATSQAIQDPYNLNIQGTSSPNLRIPYQIVEWVWDASAGFWRVANDSASGVLPRFHTTGNLAPTGNAFVEADPTGGTFTITFPTAPTEGMRVRVKNVTASTNHIVMSVAGGPAGVTAEVTPYTAGGPGTSLYLSKAYEAAQWSYSSDSNVWWLDTLINSGLSGGG
jgi:hypothetical protein